MQMVTITAQVSQWVEYEREKGDPFGVVHCACDYPVKTAGVLNFFPQWYRVSVPAHMWRRVSSQLVKGCTVLVVGSFKIVLTSGKGSPLVLVSAYSVQVFTKRAPVVADVFEGTPPASRPPLDFFTDDQVPHREKEGAL